MQGIKLQRIMYGRVCISDEYLKELIRFILRDYHVQLFSRGSCRLRCDGEWKTCPGILIKVAKRTI